MNILEATTHGREVFLTGATGLLGSALLQRLLQEGVRVHALVRTPDQANWVRALGALPVVGNLAHLDMDACRLAFLCCDTVIHLAATTDESNPERLFTTNVRGTKMLVQGAKAAGISRFIFVSTLATLSDALQAPLQAAPSAPKPGQYVMSRFLAEEVVFSGYHQGLPSIVLNLATILPPSLKGRSAFRAWLASHPLPREASTQHVHMLPLDTAVEAIWRTLVRGRPGQRYVISNREQTVPFETLIPLMVQARACGDALFVPRDHPPLFHTTTLDHGEALGLTYASPLPAIEALRAEQWLTREPVVMPWRS